MKPIINPWWIYFASVSEDLKNFLLVTGILALIVVGFWFFFSILEDIKKPPEWLIITGICFLSISPIFPSQKTVLTMMTVSQITPDNIETIGETGKDIVDYVVEKIDTILDEGDE